MRDLEGDTTMRGYIYEMRIDRNGKKYGLLSSDGDSKIYIFFPSDLTNCRIHQLQEGDAMEFEPVQNDNSTKGRYPMATSVRIVDQVSNAYSQVQPGINKSARFDHFNESEKSIIHNCLGKVFYVSSGGHQFTLNQSSYRYCIVKPTDMFQHAFHLSREIVVIFSDYVNFEPRSLDAASYVYNTISEKLRLDRGIQILICHDNEIEKKLIAILKDKNHNQIVVPFTYEELLSDSVDSLFVESRFKQYLFDVDLFAETKPIQDDIFFFAGKFFVSGKQFVVFIIVERVIRLITLLPFRRILVCDHRLVLSSEFEMLMLYDPRVWYLIFGIIYDRIALEVRNIKCFVLKPQAPVLKFSETVAEILVDHSRKHRLCRHAGQ